MCAWTVINNPLRGTGRTTKMLAEAASLAARGKRVLVVATTKAQAEHFRNVLCHGYGFAAANGSRQTAYAHHPSGGYVAIVPFNDGDAPLTRPYGSPAHDEMLVDHAVIEVQLADELAMLHRFDPLPKNAPESARG